VFVWCTGGWTPLEWRSHERGMQACVPIGLAQSVVGRYV